MNIIIKQEKEENFELFLPEVDGKNEEALAPIKEEGKFDDIQDSA